MGSWWGHPKGHAIAHVAAELADHTDVLITKLISGKVTFVHKRMWPLLFAVATSRESWQTRNLPAVAQSVLETVEREGAIQSNHFRVSSCIVLDIGKAATALEKRLLIHSEEIHTKSGAHARQLESWENWANRTDFKSIKMEAEQARIQIESAVLELNRRFGAKGTLPWQERQDSFPGIS